MGLLDDIHKLKIWIVEKGRIPTSRNAHIEREIDKSELNRDIELDIWADFIADGIEKSKVGSIKFRYQTDPPPPPPPPVNKNPVAEAGEDKIADVNTPVTLNGSKSFDPDGDPITFEWTLQSGYTNVPLTDANTPNPSFIAPDFDVVNPPPPPPPPPPDKKNPIAKIVYSPIKPKANETIQLDGSGSTDPDGQVVSYKWMISDQIVIENPSAAKTSFNIGTKGSVDVTLEVRDNDDNSNRAVVTIVPEVVNPPPPPPPPPPPVEGEIDAIGLKWMVARGAQTMIKQSRDEKTDDRWSGNVTGLRQGFEATMIARGKGTNSSSHFAMKQFGGNHSGGGASSQRWYDTGLRVDGEIQLQWEGPHPSNHDFSLPDSKWFIKKISKTLENNWLGLKWCVQTVKPNGSPSNGGIRCRMWVDEDPIGADGKPKNNWKLVYDFIDGVDAKVISPQDYQAPDEQDCEVRRSDTNSHEIYGGGLHVRKLGTIPQLEQEDLDNVNIDRAHGRLTMTADEYDYTKPPKNQSETRRLVVTKVCDASRDDEVIPESEQESIQDLAGRLNKNGEFITKIRVEDIESAHNQKTLGSPFFRAFSDNTDNIIHNPNTDTGETRSTEEGEYEERDLIFKLKVTDSKGAVSTDNVKVTVRKKKKPRPIAIIKPDSPITAKRASLIRLFGDDSKNCDVWAWKVESGNAIIRDNLDFNPYIDLFLPNEDTTIRVKLLVTHSSDIVSDIAYAEIKVGGGIGPPPPPTNRPPVANAGDNQTVKPKTNVTLNGSKSSDPDGDVLSFEWKQQSGSTVTLSNANSPNATFVSPALDVIDPPPPPPPPPPDGKEVVVWDSNINLITGKDFKVTDTYGDQSPDGKGVFMAASGDPFLDVKADGVFYLCAGKGHGRVYIKCRNYNARMEGEFMFVDTVIRNTTWRLRSRHNTGGSCENRFGGFGATCEMEEQLAEYSTEPCHNLHENTPKKPLAKKMELNKWIKFRYTVKNSDDNKKVLFLTEYDYNDGKGFVEVMRGEHPSPKPYYMNEADFKQESYAWLRINNESTGKIAYRNVRIVDLSPEKGMAKPVIKPTLGGGVVVGAANDKTLVFRLTVKDPKGLQSSDDVTITVSDSDQPPPPPPPPPDKPLASLNVPDLATAGSNITLDGSGSKNYDQLSITQVIGEKMGLQKIGNDKWTGMVPMSASSNFQIGFELLATKGTEFHKVTKTISVKTVPPPPPPGKKIKLVAFGDTDTTADAEKVQAQIMKETEVSQYLGLGDYPYSSRSTKWCSMMDKYYTPEKKAILMLNQGNHEDEESETEQAQQDIEVWVNNHNKNHPQFAMPPLDVTPPEATTTNSNWDKPTWLTYKIIGNVFVFNMNSQDMDVEFPRAQYNWVKAKIAQAKQLKAEGVVDWIIGTLHKPFFTLKSSHSPYTAVRKLVNSIFRNVVDFMLHGHNHNTQLWKPMVADENAQGNGEGIPLFSMLSDGKTYDFSKEHGWFTVVSGHAGHEHNAIKESGNQNVMWYNDKDYGYTVLEFEGKKANVIAKDITGKLLYQYAVVK